MKLRNAIATIVVTSGLAAFSLIPSQAAGIFFNFSSVFSPTLEGGLQSYNSHLLNFSTVNGSNILVGDRTNAHGNNSAGFGTDIIVTNFGPTNSNANDNTPDNFNFRYNVDLTLVPTDVSGNLLAGYVAQTQTTGVGNINGAISANQINSNGSGFLNPLVFTFTATGQDTLTYRVNFKNFLSFPAINDSALGGIQYHVVGSAAAATPEPGSLALLAGCAVTGAGFILKRRAKKRA